MTDGQIESFTIAIPDSDIEDLKDRLRRTRWIDDYDNDSWQYGMPIEYLKEITEYWADEYDWRKHEAEINSYDNYRVLIDDVPIHFLWARARKPIAALILNHGWPWTFWDYRDVIPLLVDPVDGPAFDVIVPSLPGFGFSSPLRRSGINPSSTADLWAKLMTKLGYDKFGAVGGDSGAFITAHLNHAYADRMVGTYQSLSVLPGVDWTAVSAADYDGPGEETWFEGWTSRMETARAHSTLNRKAPQTVGYAFNDSPAGLAAWIIERRRLWSDWEGDFEQLMSKDCLLTGVSIYWFTQTIGTSARWYVGYEDAFVPRHGGKLMQAPAAFGMFPKDLLLWPRSVIEKHVNLAHWTIMPKGGHFAPLEQPKLLADDVRRFFAGEIEKNPKLSTGRTI